jgi:hypothetical protein
MVRVVDAKLGRVAIDGVAEAEDLVARRQVERVDALVPDQPDHGQAPAIDRRPDPGQFVLPGSAGSPLDAERADPPEADRHTAPLE